MIATLEIGSPNKLSERMSVRKKTNESVFFAQHMAWLRSAAHVMVGVMLGCIFYGIGNDAAKTSGNVGFVFFLMLFLFFSNAMPTVLTCEILNIIN